MKIAVSSGKGGTGKTTVSTNLAMLAAESEDVVLTDLDVEEPDSGLFLKANLLKEEEKFKMIPQWNKDKCRLSGNCQQVCNYNAMMRLGDQVLVFPELCHSCYACSELCPNGAIEMVPQKIGVLRHFAREGLSFVEGRLDIGREQAVPLISQTKQYVDNNFSNGILKIFDSPPGTSCPVIESVKDADIVLLITEPTPFGLHDLKLSVDAMRQLKKDFNVVINRWGIGNDDVFDYCRKENIEIISKIRNDRKAAELYSRGELLYDKLPDFRSEIERIRDFILDRK